MQGCRSPGTGLVTTDLNTENTIDSPFPLLHPQTCGLPRSIFVKMGCLKKAMSTATPSLLMRSLWGGPRSIRRSAIILQVGLDNLALHYTVTKLALSSLIKWEKITFFLFKQEHFVWIIGSFRKLDCLCVLIIQFRHLVWFSLGLCVTYNNKMYNYSEMCDR